MREERSRGDDHGVLASAIRRGARKRTGAVIADVVTGRKSHAGKEEEDEKENVGMNVETSREESSSTKRRLSSERNKKSNSRKLVRKKEDRHTFLKLQPNCKGSDRFHRIPLQDITNLMKDEDYRIARQLDIEMRRADSPRHYGATRAILSRQTRHSYLASNDENSYLPRKDFEFQFPEFDVTLPKTNPDTLIKNFVMVTNTNTSKLAGAAAIGEKAPNQRSRVLSMR